MAVKELSSYIEDLFFLYKLRKDKETKQIVLKYQTEKIEISRIT